MKTRISEVNRKFTEKAVQNPEGVGIKSYLDLFMTENGKADLLIQGRKPENIRVNDTNNKVIKQSLELVAISKQKFDDEVKPSLQELHAEIINQLKRKSPELHQWYEFIMRKRNESLHVASDFLTIPIDKQSDERNGNTIEKAKQLSEQLRAALSEFCEGDVSRDAYLSMMRETEYMQRSYNRMKPYIVRMESINVEMSVPTPVTPVTSKPSIAENPVTDSAIPTPQSLEDILMLVNEGNKYDSSTLNDVDFIDKYFTQHPDQVNMPLDNDGNTILHYLTKLARENNVPGKCFDSYNIGIINLISNLGADPTIKNKQGASPIHQAKGKAYLEQAIENGIKNYRENNITDSNKSDQGREWLIEFADTIFSKSTKQTPTANDQVSITHAQTKFNEGKANLEKSKDSNLSKTERENLRNLAKDAFKAALEVDNKFCKDIQKQTCEYLRIHHVFTRDMKLNNLVKQTEDKFKITPQDTRNSFFTAIKATAVDIKRGSKELTENITSVFKPKR